MLLRFNLIIILFLYLTCSLSFAQDVEKTSDVVRPSFHFSPQSGWINDPNGLVFFDGEYHLFFQHHPDDIVWGPMHWGHAVSTDLLQWEELPIALYPDDLGTIFSGSVVIDKQNTAGFGQDAMVAIFTHFVPGLQQQSLAYSTDKGRTWTKYAGNPVLAPPTRAMKNFRDPKVFWYGTQEDEDGHWVMALAAGSSILFFTSNDLKQWESSGGFGLTHGATCGVWETPDLFEAEVDDTGEKLWVLTVAIGGCAPAGGSGQQYFIGNFDGESFKNANDKDLELWADYGPDFYAGQAWNNVEGRRLWTGWMSNWTYSQAVPADTWRGSMNLPRELSLTQTADGIRLKQAPLRELETLKGQVWSWENELIGVNDNLLEGIELETFELYIDFEIPELINKFGINIRKSESAATTFGYSPKAQKLFFGRGNSGISDFHDDFSESHTALLHPQSNGRIQLLAIVDKTSVELFANDGTVVLSEQFFALEEAKGLEIFVEGGNVLIHSLRLSEITVD